MAYLGNAPTSVPLSSADILDSAITTAKIANGAVTIADLSATGTASSSTFLRGDNVWGAVSSDYVLLASTDASSSASVSFDGYFSSTYKNYIMYYTNVVPVTDRQKAWIRFRRSNADVTANNYKTGGFGWNGENGALSAETTTSTAIGALQDMSNNGNNAGSGSIVLNDPLSTNTKHSFFLNQIDSWDNTNNYFRYIGLTGMLTDSNSALSGLSFYFASGNIARGNFKLYGLK